MEPIESTTHLTCMEIVGGNRAVRQPLDTPGLSIWVESLPIDGDAGGDIHYFSVCGSGRVTRMVIADVAGHGQEADELAGWLRDVMRKHINQLDQRKLARAVNQELAARMAAHDDDRFATVALLTYFAPTDHLIVCNAGHPPPLWFSRRHQRWFALTVDTPDRGPSMEGEKARYLGKPVANLPLGVIEGTDYVQFTAKLEPDDVVIVYTDGLVEARDVAGEMLGQAGLLAMAERLDPDRPPKELARSLLASVEAFRGQASSDDDQTVAVIRHTAVDPPEMTLGRMARVLPKVLGFRPV